MNVGVPWITGYGFMGKLAGYRKVLLCSAFVGAMTLGTAAQAQVMANFDNNVVVDLSVLDDGGMRASHPQASNPYAGPKIPPATMPRSQFYGVPQGIAPLTAPTPVQMQVPAQGSVPKSRLLIAPTQMAEKPVLKMPEQTTPAVKLTKPVAAPKPVVKQVEVAKAEPKPMVKVTPKPEVVEQPKAKEVVKTELPAKVVAQTPEPTPVKEEKPVEVAQPAPKPITKKPVVAEAPKVEPEPKKAPESVMAEAPPPPPSATVEPKKVTSAIATSETEKSTASLPGNAESSVRVAFQSGQSKLPSSAQDDLKKMAEDLRTHPDDRVQLQAYAGGEDLTASKARRLSLSRALAVRSYLIGQGVRSTRIDVRALGNKTTEEPFDRVDVQITPR